MARFLTRFKSLLKSRCSADEVLALVVMTNSEQFVSGDLSEALEAVRRVSGEALGAANAKILHALSPKEEYVMRHYLGLGKEQMSISEIAKEYDVGTSRIRQIFDGACYTSKQRKDRRELHSGPNQQLLRDIGVVFP